MWRNSFVRKGTDTERFILCLDAIVGEVDDLQLLEVIPDAEDVPGQGGEMIAREDDNFRLWWNKF